MARLRELRAVVSKTCTPRSASRPRSPRKQWQKIGEAISAARDGEPCGSLGSAQHQARLAFGVSVTCYRYQLQLSSENAEIADHLIRVTHNQRNWGFSLCFLYLRNVKGHSWNHKRVYRIDRELQLNLRIKPRTPIVREKPEPLALPPSINHCWSMDFRHDQLAAGRSFRLFNLTDDFNRPDTGCEGWVKPVLR